MRVVRSGGGGLAVGRHLPGRGAWLCRGSVDCLEAAIRRKGFSRALRAPVEPQEAAAIRSQLGRDDRGRSKR